MGGACSTHGRQSRCMQDYGGEMKKSHHLNTSACDGRIFKMNLQETGWEGAKWADLIRYRHK